MQLEKIGQRLAEDTQAANTYIGQFDPQQPAPFVRPCV
jgi:hypothetical protein